jgi:nucleotide-binding universal stress UspA family protein
MFRRILVPIDGSDIARRGLQAGIRLAQQGRGRIRLLHVVELGPMIATPEAGAYVSDMFEVMREEGKKLLAKAHAEAAKSGVQAEAVLVDNPYRVADAITREAKKWRADLIVLGTHGRRGVKRLILGSDAEQVVRLAPVPVLLIRAGTRKAGRR